jgi:hypothetical protein
LWQAWEAQFASQISACQRFSILAFDFEILPGSLSAFSVSDFQCLIGLFLLSQFQLCFLPWVFSLVRCISAVNKE